MDHTAVQLGLDEVGAHVQVVDRQGRQVDVDPRTARGALRDLLRALASVRRRQQDVVEWETGSDRIYLHEHGHLLWPLRRCAAVVGERMEPLGFDPGAVEIVLEVAADPAKEPDWLTGQLRLVRDGESVAQRSRISRE